MKFWHWLRRRHEIDDDLRAEIRSHLAMATRDQMEDGQDPETARLAAMKEFGNVLQTTEATRRVYRGGAVEWIVDVYQDVRFGVRQLRRNAGFSIAVIAVLTLGVGGNAAVFSMFKALALSPLPGVPDSASLAVVAHRTIGGRLNGTSFLDFKHFREHAQGFEGLAATDMQPVILGLGRTGERVWCEIVTGNYFQLLGVGAQLGRTLLPSDEVAPGQHPVVVLSDGLWRRSFGADPAIVGKTIQVNRQPLTVVGVADRAFQGTIVSLVMELYVPVMMQPTLSRVSHLDSRSAAAMVVFRRLKPGVSIAAASAEIGVLGAQAEADNPLPTPTNERAEVLPLWRSPFGAQTYMMPVVVLLGVMGTLVLIIVCANVANLVLVRGVGRRGELAVRVALGAGRGRILRLLFVENLVRALPGAILGVILAAVALPILRGSAAAAAPMRVNLDTSVDWMVVTFAVVLSCLSALVFGFVPALRTSRVDVAGAMKDDATGRAGTRARLRGALVVAQVAVSVVLLVAAGLVFRGLETARGIDAGFDPLAVGTASVDLQPGGYTNATGPVFLARLLREIRNDPSIESASVARYVPLTLVETGTDPVEVEGYEPRADEDLQFMFNSVGPDYFATLRIKMLAGREFADDDDASTPKVAIVNETMARRFWQSPEGAIGKRIANSPGEWHIVVGVARDVKYARLTETPRPYVYLAAAQNYRSDVLIHARSRATGAEVLDRLQYHVRAIDPDLPILSARLLTEQARGDLGNYEMAASALVMFGAMTIALSALGIYGLVAYTVRQSTQEIGIRIAVGASRGDVVKRFVGRGLRLAAIGTALGLAVAIAIIRLLANLIGSLDVIDVTSFVAATALVLTIALGASVVPAWRGSRLDPLTALRRH
ncbi:MAG: ABC transporter permease [Acidobacteriota bacterium]|nr:ABC transporter permease [Acidobacteriota bacterium]